MTGVLRGFIFSLVGKRQGDIMERTLLQQYFSAIVRTLVEMSDALSDIDHRLTKGQLREFLVSRILSAFLTSEFGIGTGIVVNKNGEESNQIDIIIYDNRILPPFIKEQSLGVYPAESAIATIEVKSRLTKTALLKAEEDAKKLKQIVFNPKASLYKRITKYKALYEAIPLCAIIGFYGSGVKELSKNAGETWLNEKIKYLFDICLVKKYCWAKVGGKGWTVSRYDKKTNEETKRFVALLLDNIKTCSQNRFRLLPEEGHLDLFSAYIRK